MNEAQTRFNKIDPKLRNAGWTVCWLDGTIDIAPEHLYELSVAA